MAVSYVAVPSSLIDTCNQSKKPLKIGLFFILSVVETHATVEQRQTCPKP